MKYLVTYCFLCSAIQLSAQTGLAPQGAEWFTKNGWSEVWSGGYTYSAVEKDTVYSNTNCRKILRVAIEPDGQSGIDIHTMAPLYVYDTPDTVFYYNHLFAQFVPSIFLTLTPA